MKKILIISLALIILLAACETTQTQTKANDIDKKDEVSDAIKYYDFGKEYLKNKQYDSAIKNFTNSINDSAGFIDAYTGLGRSYEGKFDYTRAESVYTSAKDKFPKSTAGYNGLGGMYLKMKQYEDAEKAFLSALAIDSMDSKSYYGLGQVYDKKKPTNKELSAIKCYEKSCRFDPEDLAAAYAYSKALMKAERYKEALDLLKKVSDDHPTFVEPLANLAEAYLETKQYQEAINTYNKVNALDSTITNTYLGIARAYQGMKKYDMAEQNFKKLISLMPSSTIPYLYMGQMYLDINNYTKAIDNLNLALAKNPNDENALLLIAQSYFLKVDPNKVNDDNYDAALKTLETSESYFSKLITLNKYVKEANTGLDNIKKRKKEIDPTRW
ncbi:MAG: tetratricopeptide repeat protein [bacterium]|nr:tetratricopeptide repeat protein [bacterium]